MNVYHIYYRGFMMRPMKDPIVIMAKSKEEAGAIFNEKYTFFTIFNVKLVGAQG